MDLKVLMENKDQEDQLAQKVLEDQLDHMALTERRDQ